MAVVVINEQLCYIVQLYFRKYKCFSQGTSVIFLCSAFKGYQFKWKEEFAFVFNVCTAETENQIDAIRLYIKKNIYIF